jgi:hypothetical protein
MQMLYGTEAAAGHEEGIDASNGSLLLELLRESCLSRRFLTGGVLHKTIICICFTETFTPSAKYRMCGYIFSPQFSSVK